MGRGSGGGGREKETSLGFQEGSPWGLEDKEEREQGEWLAWSMEGSHAPRVLSWERLQGASFSGSVKKSEMSGCRERSGPRGELQPVFIYVFPKIKKKRDREEKSMRGRESFANKFQQYFEILIFGTKQLLKYCKYFGLLTSIEIRKGEEGFI
jgi:hypothetical protein